MKFEFLLLVLLLLGGCNAAKEGAFGHLETAPSSGSVSETVYDTVHINSFTPIVDPLVITATSSTVFGVTVPGNVGTMDYNYVMDNSTSLQSGSSPFFTLSGSSVALGTHELKVIAKNSATQDEKTFRIRKNNPTSIVSFTPAATGASVVCGSGSITFTGIMSDLDGDPFTANWDIDNAPVSSSTPFASVTTINPFSQLAYSPDCTKIGTHILNLRISDGYEVTIKSWTFTVSAPASAPGSVQILNFSPTTSPVVLTNDKSSTFGVTIGDGAGTVTYDFIKDGNDNLQSGSTSFYSLAGSTLTPGYHSLKVHVSNATSVDEKVFNIRKNSAPVVQISSPALTGNSMSCSGDTITLQASFNDIDSDAIVPTWKIDEQLVGSSTPFTVITTTASTTRLVYTPDCTKSGAHSFNLSLNDGYESTSQTWSVIVNNPPAPPGAVVIQTFTPTVNPVVLTSSADATFAVTVPDGTGAVSYEFKKDSAVVQTSGSPFYVLSGSSLSAGNHTLTVKASNSVSSDQKVFNIRRNTPTSVVSYTPALTGATVNCGTGSLTFSGIMSDADSDTFSINWELDNNAVTASTPFASVSTTSPYSQLVYSPDCTKTGAHILTLRISDGYETTTRTWTFNVSNPPTPPGNVQILTFSPTVAPVILTATNSVTFGVTVADGSGTISYDFVQDNSTVLQSSSTSFYSLNGASLTPGYHSIKVHAANANSFDEKVFNVRKNTPPAIQSYTPALTGNAINCSGNSITLQSGFTDYDSDNVSVTWKVDDSVATGSTGFSVITNTSSLARLVYTPDCTQAGVHTFNVILTDGHEITSQTWTVTVNNPPAPPGNVTIQTFTPTINPVVMTGSTSATFAVSVPDGTGVVTYEFKKDYTTDLQTSTTPFFILSGSSLSAGVHTLKVKASNSVSFDEKIFNVRKNTPTAVASYSPAAAGSVVNCGEGSLTFNAIMNDVDNDSFTMAWELDNTPVTGSTPMTSVATASTSSQLVYTPDCSKSGYHTLVLKVSDGYELTTQSWTFNVVNPTVESLTAYYPFSNTIYALSTDTSKTFTASGTGIGALTFKWKVDGTVVQTNTNVSSSTLDLSMSSISVGSHTIQVVLTDSTSSNDPTVPATQSWSIYKNAKPRFISFLPANGTKINILSSASITANIEDALDTFTVSITKGALNCSTASACGLSAVSKPTATGMLAATFNPNTSFLGDNTFTISVLDSHGESVSMDLLISVNYFTDACNNLAKGGICTLVGLPGLGSNINVNTNSSKVRITPSWMTMDELGNFFFSDHSTHTVWYYNVSSSSVTLLGVTIPANTIYVVAGTGVPSAGSSGIAARKFGLNFNVHGGGLAWDSDRKELFIADYNNSRVVKVGPDGRAAIVCGGSSALTTQGALAKDSKCANPVDVEFDVANRRLYISQQSDHVVKYVDASNASYVNWPSYILGGAYNGNSTVSGTSNLTAFPGTTTAGAARFNQPWGLSLDPVDQILYVTEWNQCKIRAIGLPGATSRTIGSQSITATNANTISNGGSCTNSTINTDTAISSMVFNKPVEVIPHKASGIVAGLFIADMSGNRVIYMNNTASPVTIGNQTIAGGMASNIFGNGSTAPTNPPTGKTSAIISPIGLAKSGNNLYVGARGSSIIRSIDISSANATPGNLLGGTPRAGYSGNTPSDSRLVTFNNPLSLMYRAQNNLIYVSDSANYMIRSINVSTGVVQDFIGTGSSGTETLLNTVTTSTRITSPRGMAFLDDFFLYADISNNCFVRAFNSYNSDQTVFNSLVNQNRTSVVAGYANTCGNFVGTAPLNTTNTNAKLDNPYGIGVDQNSRVMYVASSNSHCILKVTESGTMVPFIGTCGTAGSASSPIYGGTFNDAALTLRFPTEIFMDTTPGLEGNFFFVDYSDTAKAHVKYVNLVSNSAVSFPGGITVSKNNVETVFAGSASPGYIRSVTGMEDWLCYTSGNNATNQGNNTVVCRNRVTSGTYVFGVAGEGGISPEGTDEGAIITDVSSTVSLAVPSGLTFDTSGNLYISEMNGQVIRMIKKWW